MVDSPNGGQADLNGEAQGFPAYQVPFIDESARDPSLVAFRDALLSVIRERDIDGLLSMTDKNVVVRTNICGRGELRNRLREDEDVWEDWERVLSQGGAFEADGTFVAPWFHVRWPCPFPFPEEGYRARTPSTALRAEPGADARVLRDIGGELVEVLVRHGYFREVRTVDGLAGYVAPGDLEVLYGSGFHLRFSKHYGRWRLDYASSPYW